MSWSTRELAELAGTTLRTVRHYHDLGLLDLPARGSNGYKHYDTSHLERLLRIRQLVQLGLTLPQIQQALGPDGLSAAEVRELDHRISATMRRLQAARDDLAALITRSDREAHHLSRDPGELSGLKLSPADESFLGILATVVSPETKEAYLTAVRATADNPLLAELDALDADADEQTRAQLADAIAAHVKKLHTEYPPLQDVLNITTLTRSSAQRALSQTVREVYNPAQVDVVRRIAALVHPE